MRCLYRWLCMTGCENPNVIEIADCCNLGLKLKADYEVITDQSMPDAVEPCSMRI